MDRYIPYGRFSEDDYNNLTVISEDLEFIASLIDIFPSEVMDDLHKKKLNEYRDLSVHMLRKLWDSSYILYATDHNLIADEHDIIQICNRHRAWQIISSGRIVSCTCRLSAEGAEHSYTFGNPTCASNTRTVVCLPEVKYIGFIGYPDPIYSLAHSYN